jgi:hypothetical protein
MGTLKGLVVEAPSITWRAMLPSLEWPSWRGSPANSVPPSVRIVARSWKTIESS